MEYVLFCYVASLDMWSEFKTSCSLKSLKNYVAAERNEHQLLMPLYIRNGKRVVKRYKEVKI